MATSPSVNWTIRAARPGDASAISDVLTAAGLAAWSDFLGADRIEGANRGRRHPADLVAEDESDVFAFVARDPTTGEILRLYTHPRAWGRGAARALLDRARGATPGGRDAGVAQHEERNERGRGFYERHGWREDGEPRTRDWHGARLREPPYVCEL